MLPNPCCVSHPGLSYGPLKAFPCNRGPGPSVPGNFKIEAVGNGFSGILRTRQRVTRSLFVQIRGFDQIPSKSATDLEEEKNRASLKLPIIRSITGTVPQ